MTEPSRAHGAAQQIFRGALALAEAKLASRDAMLSFDGEAMGRADRAAGEAWLQDIHGGVKVLLAEIATLEEDLAVWRHSEPQVPVLRSVPQDHTRWNAFATPEEMAEHTQTNGHVMV